MVGGAIIKKRKFLLIASYPDSLIKFRGPLIDALLNSSLEVSVIVPGLLVDSDIYRSLEAKGVRVYDVAMQRTGLNPISDFLTIILLLRLMVRIKPDYILGYTIKPVIYGALAAWMARVDRRFALITGLGYAFTGDSEGKRRLLRKLLKNLYRFALSKTHSVFFSKSR